MRSVRRDASRWKVYVRRVRSVDESQVLHENDMTVLKRDTSTPSNRAFWRRVDDAAERVAKWPHWKGNMTEEAKKDWMRELDLAMNATTGSVYEWHPTRLRPIFNALRAIVGDLDVRMHTIETRREPAIAWGNRVEERLAALEKGLAKDAVIKDRCTACGGSGSSFCQKACAVLEIFAKGIDAKQQSADAAMHPNGQCTCHDEGTCEWCKGICPTCGGDGRAPETCVGPDCALKARVYQLEVELDAAIKRAEAAEQHAEAYAKVCKALGTEYDPDNGPTEPGPIVGILTTEQERRLEWRCIEPGNECKTCGGSGVRLYGATSTWRGGYGGQELSHDVCDQCWGSGDATNKWTDIRKLNALLKSRGC